MTPSCTHISHILYFGRKRFVPRTWFGKLKKFIGHEKLCKVITYINNGYIAETFKRRIYCMYAIPIKNPNNS